MNDAPYLHVFNRLAISIPLRMQQRDAGEPITNGLASLKGDIELFWVMNTALERQEEFITVETASTNLTASIERYHLTDWVAEFSPCNN